MGQVTSLIGDQDKKNEQQQDAARLIHREIEAENKKFIANVLHSGHAVAKLLPVRTVLKTRSFVQQKESFSMDDITKDVSDLVSGILSGSTNLGGAVSGGLTVAAKALLANTAMSYKKQQGYSITVGILGGIQRLDYLMVSRSFESESWSKQMKKIASGVIVLSIVDTSYLKANDASVLVQNCFKESSMEVQAAIRKLLLIELSSLTETQKREQTTLVYDELPQMLLRSGEERIVDEQRKKALEQAALEKEAEEKAAQAKIAAEKAAQDKANQAAKGKETVKKSRPPLQIKDDYQRRPPKQEETRRDETKEEYNVDDDDNAPPFQTRYYGDDNVDYYDFNEQPKQSVPSIRKYYQYHHQYQQQQQQNEQQIQQQIQQQQQQIQQQQQQQRIEREEPKEAKLHDLVEHRIARKIKRFKELDGYEVNKKANLLIDIHEINPSHQFLRNYPKVYLKPQNHRELVDFIMLHNKD